VPRKRVSASVEGFPYFYQKGAHEGKKTYSLQIEGEEELSIIGGEGGMPLWWTREGGVISQLKEGRESLLVDENGRKSSSPEWKSFPGGEEGKKGMKTMQKQETASDCDCCIVRRAEGRQTKEKVSPHYTFFYGNAHTSPKC